jgi:hypothetical protein
MFVRAAREIFGTGVAAGDGSSDYETARCGGSGSVHDDDDDDDDDAVAAAWVGMN